MPSVVVSEGIEPMGIVEGPYTGKPNPHAWMSPNAALIYVDNIRDAFVEARPGQRRDLQGQCRGLQGRRSRRRSTPIRAKALGHSARAPLAGVERGRLQLSRPRLRPEGALSLADQCRPAGHAAAGPQGDRRRAREQDPRRVFSESTISDQTRPSRSPARPGPNMVACSMSTRSARPTVRCRPISICCA